MEISFHKETYEARILDPSEGFEEKKLVVEVRTDPFTGAKARILKHRWRLPKGSFDQSIISKSKQKCPFCPENIEKMTPKFPSDIVAEGRINHGQSTLIPNAFPYSRYNGVIIVSKDHFLSLDRFAPEILYDGFQASLLYIDQIRQFDDKVAYASINWNYMPPAGGGIIHPHWQIVVDNKPTRFHERLLSQSLKYHMAEGRNYWADLISLEKEKKVRYAFQAGKVVFIAAYAPRGMLGEVIAIFERARTLDEVAQDGWRDFSQGLSKVLGCLHGMGIDSLNMALIANLDNAGHFWTQARIIARASVPPLGTSDVNYFEKLHGEIIAVISPEELAERLRLACDGNLK